MLTSAPEAAPGITAGLKALLTSAAFAPLDNIGWIRVTGSDRVRWLNGMVTNNIAALKPGEGCYNFFLNAQGRIQGDATAWLTEYPDLSEDSILSLQTERDRIPSLMAMLDHFIIMDDVQLSADNVSRGLMLAGPDAAALIASLGWTSLPDAPLQLVNDRNPSDELIHANSPLVPVYEMWAAPGNIDYLIKKLETQGVQPATSTDLEHLRILSGTPLYGVDIRDKDLAQETNQTRALHFSKGCYLGQEIVERVRSRGNVHRTFGGFILTGQLPEPGAALHDPAKPERPIGELTSAARIQLPSGITRQFALGYIRREALDTHAAITYPGGTATPSALPFPIS